MCCCVFCCFVVIHDSLLLIAHFGQSNRKVKNGAAEQHVLTYVPLGCQPWQHQWHITAASLDEPLPTPPTSPLPTAPLSELATPFTSACCLLVTLAPDETLTLPSTAVREQQLAWGEIAWGETHQQQQARSSSCPTIELRSDRHPYHGR